ncbi:hypothetical protein EV363DRAFT_1182709 [Boletus edulis]|nr:hypothetical protein EV363DRAFT_1182709 [Boletus edulis]
MFGEVVYYTRLALRENEDGEARFADVALVWPFSPPDQDMLCSSHMTVPICHTTEAVLVVNLRDIISVVAMVPYRSDGNREGEESYFAMERPGLAVSQFFGAQEDEIDPDDVEE